MSKSLQRALYLGLGIFALAAMDLSSYCHPDEAAPDMVAIGTARAATPVAPLVLPEADAAERDFRELTWAELADVDFKDVYLEELDSYYWKPVFGPQVFAAEGEDVYITGYVIRSTSTKTSTSSPVSLRQLLLLRGAGPSVVDLRFSDADHRTYQTDERLTFHGNLRLNADDVYQMNYILEGAEEHPSDGAIRPQAKRPGALKPPGRFVSKRKASGDLRRKATVMMSPYRLPNCSMHHWRKRGRSCCSRRWMLLESSLEKR